MKSTPGKNNREERKEREDILGFLCVLRVLSGKNPKGHHAS
jgi:hypothetical protein